MENSITPEMIEAGKFIASTKLLELNHSTDKEEIAKYWHCMVLVQGYNVHPDGSLTVRTKGYNDDKLAG